MTTDSAVGLTVVIPVLNDAEALARLLQALAPWRGPAVEVIVADGGSTDGSLAVAEGVCDRVVAVPRGRARQMNAGAAVARGDRLWFLHADCDPPPAAPERIARALRRRRWGRFDVRLSGGRSILRVVAACMNRRSCWTGICTGDQGLFMTREVFAAVGGFPDQPLMEDIAFSVRAKRRFGRPACTQGPLVSSSRRWEQDGVWRTIALMWHLRLAYALGASPAALHRRYYGGPPVDET